MKIKIVRKIPFSSFIKNPEYVRLKIIPDSSARNWRAVDIVKTISEQYRLPIDRIERDGWKLVGYHQQERSSFEISFEGGKVNFYMVVAKKIVPLMQRRLYSVWDKATVDIVGPATPFDIDKTVVYELLYRKHDMYSLHADAKDNLPLGSLIESGRLLSEGERASVVTRFEPIYQVGWQHEITTAWQKLRKGTAPRKIGSSGRELAKTVAIGITSVLRELIVSVADLIGDGNNIYKDKPNDPEASYFAISNLSESTKAKASRGGIKTQTWTFVESEELDRADIIARSIALSYGDLSGDNELEPKKVVGDKKAALVEAHRTNRTPTINIRYNVMSFNEASKFCQLPGSDLQEKYTEIEVVAQKEVEIADKDILDPEGIEIGVARFKGQEKTVHQPTKDEDEVCLPHVGIGGMGQGKTRGLLANYLLEAVRKGYGGVAIDPAKRQIGDEIQFAVDKGALPKEKFVRINLGREVFSLDFCEALHDERSRARLANMVVHFFDIAEETTGQTERFLRAAVMALTTGRLEEIFQIFEKEEKLTEAIAYLDAREDEFNGSTLKEYKAHSLAMRRKITSPIYNRINDVLSDPHLAKCMKSNNSLDFVKIFNERKAFVIDVPSDDLDKVAIDIIVSLLSLKIDLAMRMREKVNGEEFPFFVLIDEPHQFSKSTKTWEDAVVESRKYRICYFWTFHYWEQIPNKLQKAIRSALPHYHLYPSSTATWNSLKDEIYPFVLADALKLKRWTAINIIRSGGENATPFIAQMALPPSKKY